MTTSRSFIRLPGVTQIATSPTCHSMVNNLQAAALGCPDENLREICECQSQPDPRGHLPRL